MIPPANLSPEKKRRRTVFISHLFRDRGDASNGDKVERNCGDVANATGGLGLPLHCALCRTNKMFDESTLRPANRIRPVIYRIVEPTALKKLPTQTKLITSPVSSN